MVKAVRGEGLEGAVEKRRNEELRVKRMKNVHIGIQPAQAWLFIGLCAPIEFHAPEMMPGLSAALARPVLSLQRIEYWAGKQPRSTTANHATTTRPVAVKNTSRLDAV